MHETKKIPFPFSSKHRIFTIISGGLIPLAIVSLAAAAIDPADSHPGLNLIPWPKAVEVKEGEMKISPTSRIIAGEGSLTALAEILSGEIQVLTGLKLALAADAPRPSDIVLKINKALKADEQILMTRPPEIVRTTDGAHVLTIGEQAVVEGFDYRAVAEGTATLLQSLRQAGGQVWLPRIQIKDWPHADYCSMMVDCGRQEQPIETLKRMTETCRMYKVRYLHLHLTDDQGWCFPSTKYPQLGSKNFGAHGGLAPKVYPLEELKALVAYADARGVTLVPELEVPGHSGAALRSLPEIFDAINPETKQPVGMGCMNMASEDLYAGLDTIIGEMCDVFKSSPYFHIGSDEVTMGRVSLHNGYKAFMEKHGLKNDGELANYFIAQVNEIVKKHGKKAIKWEGIANTAAKDLIIMTWDGNSNMASQLISQGYSTITCPWDLGVPWEEWSMYVCNGSKLKKGDSVLGGTLVAWEQTADVLTRMVRNVASRQERTWGPDNTVTEQGFAARFQAQDAAVGKLIGLPAKACLSATFSNSLGTCDLLEPVFALDGSAATFYKSATVPKLGDHFTIDLTQTELIYGAEILTGINGKGLSEGAELQVSTDGKNFTTVARVAMGAARAVLSANQVKSVRLLSSTPQKEAMILREMKLQRMVEVAGVVADPAKALGEGNVAVLKADASFQWGGPPATNLVVNKDFTLRFDSGGGNAMSYSGPISGSGKVEIHMGGAEGGFRDSPMVLGGTEPNTMKGAWMVKSGRLVLGKTAGVDALGGSVIVGGQGNNDCLYWTKSNQVNDASEVELLDSPKGAATLNLNGCDDNFASLKMTSHSRILTDGQAAGGVLTVASLTIDGKSQPNGIYTSSLPWISGMGFVVVGNSHFVDAAGVIENANATIGEQNIARLTAATTFGPATGNCAIPVRMGQSGFSFHAAGDRPTIYSGFLTGTGGVNFSASTNEAAPSSQALEIAGPAANSYKGPTSLVRGTLKLNKPQGVTAIPGDLTLGGGTPANAGDAVVLNANGQFSSKSTVTLNGKLQPCYLDLAGHKTSLEKVLVDGLARIRTGTGGELSAKQIIVDGKRIANGTHQAPQPWLEGSGSVTINPVLDVKGRYGGPSFEIGTGNVGNMVADTEFWVGVGDCDVDLVTNGHTITFDSGDGNALCYRGAISGTGNVVLLMGPSGTGYKDAPLRLAGEKANTTSGKFIARKGRVQLEKPDGVDAISGDAVVGGQGFNDCLHWIHSNQIKDTSAVTLLSAGNSGPAYLSLNGCDEKVASLTMAANTTVHTDSPEGKSGTLTVHSLIIADVSKPAGTYTSATEKWIEGKGKVIVAP